VEILTLVAASLSSRADACPALLFLGARKSLYVYRVKTRAKWSRPRVRVRFTHILSRLLLEISRLLVGISIVILMSIAYYFSTFGLDPLMVAALVAFGLVAFGFLGMGPVTIAVDSYGR